MDLEKCFTVHLTDLIDLYWILFDRFFSVDEIILFSISYCSFCLKLWDTLYLHLQCHMVLSTLYTTCVSGIIQFMSRILTFLPVHDYSSLCSYQICKISEVSLHTILWSTWTIHGAVTENLRRNNEEENGFIFSEQCSYWGCFRFLKC